jgi:hypothetical protein
MNVLVRRDAHSFRRSQKGAGARVLKDLSLLCSFRMPQLETSLSAEGEDRNCPASRGDGSVQ